MLLMTENFWLWGQWEVSEVHLFLLSTGQYPKKKTLPLDPHDIQKQESYCWSFYNLVVSQTIFQKILERT